MPYVASSRASAGLLGGGAPRVLDVSWARDASTGGEALRAVVSVLPGRLVGEVVYDPVDAQHGAVVAERADRAGRARSVGVTEGLLRAGEAVMAQVEALEAVKARVEADLLAAYGALHTIQVQQVEALPRGGSAVRMARLVSPERVVAEEVALATGVGVGEVSRRLTVATAPRRHRRILHALRCGATSLHRAVQVACETALLSDADVAVVEEAVLAPSRDGRVVGQRTFTARLRRAMASVDARGAVERRAHARARRGVFGRVVEDGMGCLTLTADAACIAAVLDRLDSRARALRGTGDPRTLDQLRCDLATEALLRGHAVQSRGGEAATGEAALAAARVWLVVPFEVATGASDTGCELPGHGWVTAAHAREIMTRPGSVWHTVPVDIATGAAITGPTTAYRPTRAMVEHVRALDGTCRGPDCHVPATRCDLDHETPWPVGETSVTNVSAKHRLHHNLKTHHIWTSTQIPDHGLQWTTLTGRTYTTYPKNWREGLDPPAGALDPATAPDDRDRDEAVPPFQGCECVVRRTLRGTPTP
ncbi:13E12 repeat family protein [Terrabacter terrigena]